MSMTPTPDHASHARRAAEEILLTCDGAGKAAKAVALQQAIDAATADIKDQWRMSSVCRDKQAEIDRLKADLAASRSLLEAKGIEV
mgnify:CR=1 FL=1